MWAESQIDKSGIKDVNKKVNADGYIEKPFTLSTFIETIQLHAG